MLKVFDALPDSIWLLICPLLFAGWATTAYRLQGEQASHAKTQATYAAQVAAAEQSTRIESEKNRAIEQELSRAQETHAQEIVALRQERDTARSSGRVVAERLRHAASEAAERAGEACADPGSTELRQTAQTTLRMLAELRDQADHHAGVLAQFATDAHLAGLACERRYDESYDALMVQ